MQLVRRRLPVCGRLRVADARESRRPLHRAAHPVVLASIGADSRWHSRHDRRPRSRLAPSRRSRSRSRRRLAVSSCRLRDFDAHRVHRGGGRWLGSRAGDDRARGKASRRVDGSLSFPRADASLALPSIWASGRRQHSDAARRKPRCGRQRERVARRGALRAARRRRPRHKARAQRAAMSNDARRSYARRSRGSPSNRRRDARSQRAVRISARSARRHDQPARRCRERRSRVDRRGERQATILENM